MYAVANCTASVLRGTGTDTYGDDTDLATVVQSGVSMALREVASRVYDRESQTTRIVREMAAQVQSDVDLRPEDRLLDEGTGLIYLVQNVTRPLGPGLTADQEVDLKRVT